MFRFNTQNTLRIAFVAIIITISGVFIISFRNSKGVRDTTTAVKKTQSVLLDGQELVNAILENESAARGYVISGNPEFLSRIRYTKGVINEEYYELDSTLVRGGSEIIVENQLLPLVRARVAYSDEMVRVYDSLGPAAANKLVTNGRGKILTDSVNAVMDLIKNRESAALAVRETSNQSSVRKLNVILYSMLGFVLLFGLLALTRIAHDFSKMHSQQARLRDYTELVEHSHVVAWDLNKGILFWNEGMEGLYGWKKEEVMGKKTHELFKTEFPLPWRKLRKYSMKKVTGLGNLNIPVRTVLLSMCLHTGISMYPVMVNDLLSLKPQMILRTRKKRKLRWLP
ncbi:MAG: CHASE3 domain-containing protein [Chitinophagaceae bacterium]|nr:CHASE3 domain-containing protein [Chitinophagaceae bacterium]